MNADTSVSATDSVAELTAIEALGPLFKITEVFLWDDAMFSAPEAYVHVDSFGEELTTSCTSADVNSSVNHAIDDYRDAEDIELAKEMDALGLPISFCTTKQKNSISVKAKRKGLQAKSVYANKDMENRVPGASRYCILEDNSSSRVLQDSTNILLCSKTTEGDIEAFFQDSCEDRDRSVLQSDGESLSVAAAILGHTGEKQHGNNGSDVIMINCAEDELSPSNVNVKMSAEDLEYARSSYPEIFLGNDMEDGKSGAYQEELFHKDVVDSYVEGSHITCCVTGENKDDDGIKNLDSYHTSRGSSLPCASADHVLYYTDSCIEVGDWRVMWDPFYNRNYFCNLQSQQSTWYPPPGLEHFAFCSTTSNSNELFTDTSEDPTGIAFACDAMHDIDLHGSHDGASLIQGKEVDFEYLHHLSGVISTRMNDDLTEDFGHAESDEHAIVTKIADEKISLRMPMDHSSDELVMNEYGRKQEKQITSEEACIAPHDHLIGNSLNATGDGSSSPSTSLISSMDDLDSYNEIGSKKKRKKRIKRLKSKITLQGVDGGLPPSLVKYWCQRYLLFAQFDKGVKMDEEGWFSVTPESLARHHASRCGSGIIIDCFTGVGGNAIQFAMKGNHVVAIDIDPQKIYYAQHNAFIYGVSDRINFIIGDFLQIAPHLKATECGTIFINITFSGKMKREEVVDKFWKKRGYGDELTFLWWYCMKVSRGIPLFGARGMSYHSLRTSTSATGRLHLLFLGDVIFMSPPWGGPDYTKVQAYDIRTMLKPHDGQYLFEVARAISPRVVMFLPRNVDLNQLAELSLSVNPPWALEVEKNFLNGKLKAITAYFDNPVL